MVVTPIKFSRLAFLILTVFVVVDLYPHPSLSHSLIGTSLSKVQQAVTQSTN